MKAFKRLAVIAHGGASGAVQRHLPNWLENAEEIVFVTPADDALEIPGFRSIRCGRSEREGISCIDRMRLGAKLLSSPLCGMGELGALIEYDCLFGDLDKKVNHQRLQELVYNFDHLVGFGFVGGDGDRKFLGTTFGHCPWVAKRTVWEIIYRSAFSSPENGTPDRWIGYIVEREMLGFYDLGGICANTIGPEHHRSIIARAAEAFSIHGVKDLVSAELFLTRARP